jgi:hypothetical protein
MAVETLKIVLTADNKQAIAGMNETVNSLNKVSDAGAKTGGAVTKMGTNFTGLSRVIQDLPYGFNAISNNLTQLVPAAGAAGLAFSGIVTALTFAQIGFGAWTRGMGSVDEGMIAATKSVAEFSVSVKNIQNDILAARQGVISKEEALKRYNEALGKSTGYANSLDEAEKLMAANTNIVVQSLNLRARAQIMYQNAAQASAKLVTGEVAKMGFDAETLMASIKAGFTGKNAFDVVADRAIEAATNTELLTKEGDKLIKQSLELEKALTKGTGDPTGKGKGKGDTEESKEKKALAEMLKAREAYFAEIERMAADAEMKKDQRRLKEMKGEFDPIKQEATANKQKDLTNLKLTMDGNTALNQVKQQQIAIDDQLNARNELANKLTDRAMQGISGVLNAMANGGNIGEAFGNMFKQLAIDIALAAAKAAIFQAILSAINPVGGASKAGGFLKGFGKLLGFAQGGTVSGPQSGYPVMLHGTEHIVRPDQMKSIIASAAQMGGTSGSRVVVEGRIRGNDIFLSQQRTGTFRNLTT